MSRWPPRQQSKKPTKGRQLAKLCEEIGEREGFLGTLDGVRRDVEEQEIAGLKKKRDKLIQEIDG